MGLRELRKSKGIKSYEMAERVGLSRGGYANIESGHKGPGLGTARKIAKELGTTVDRLFVCDEPAQKM